MVVGSNVLVQMSVRNTSRKIWPEDGVNMVRLSYHWYTTDGKQLSTDLWTQNRARLPFDVEPEHNAILQICLKRRACPAIIYSNGIWLRICDLVCLAKRPTLDVPVKVVTDPVVTPSPPPQAAR